MLQWCREPIVVRLTERVGSPAMKVVLTLQPVREMVIPVLLLLKANLIRLYRMKCLQPQGRRCSTSLLKATTSVTQAFSPRPTYFGWFLGF